MSSSTSLVTVPDTPQRIITLAIRRTAVVLVLWMNPSKPSAPSTEILSIAAGYEFPISVTGRSTQFPADISQQGSPNHLFLGCLPFRHSRPMFPRAWDTYSPAPTAHVPQEDAPYCGRESQPVSFVQIYFGVIGGRICPPMSLWLRARTTRLREKLKARRGITGCSLGRLLMR